MIKATLRLPDDKIENFEIKTAELLSSSIDEMRTKVNDRLTDLCNLEKAKKGQPAVKKPKVEEDEDEEIEEWKNHCDTILLRHAIKTLVKA